MRSATCGEKPHHLLEHAPEISANVDENLSRRSCSLTHEAQKKVFSIDLNLAEVSYVAE